MTKTKRMKNVLGEKGILLEFSCPEECMVYTDTFLLDNVLDNYLSNAVTYCMGEEKRISITVVENESCYTVKVFNTGERIKEEDIKHLWESFYRADKTHSRADGKFGLGLSIVKTAQTILGRNYGVNNMSGGVEFWFDVCKQP